MRHDIQHNDIQQNDDQHNNKLNITFSIMVECCFAGCHLCLLSMLTDTNKPIKLCAGNTNSRGRLSTVDHLVKLACL
jgi:hypothetical protein